MRKLLIPTAVDFKQVGGNAYQLIEKDGCITLGSCSCGCGGGSGCSSSCNCACKCSE